MENKRDQVYYVPSLVFKVEDTLFCAPRRRFEESQVFADMFRPSHGQEGLIEEGMNDAHPIILESIKAEDFRAFLDALYPGLFKDTDTLTEKECVSALSLATAWFFTRVRQQLIDKLVEFDMPPARFLKISRNYDFRKGARAAVWALACREERLSLDEARDIGVDFVLEVDEAREKRMSTLLSAVSRCISSGRIVLVEHADYFCGVHEPELKGLAELRDALAGLRCRQSVFTSDDRPKGRCDTTPLQEQEEYK